MQNEVTGFNLRLTRKMQEQNISQADLCKITGLTTSMISYYCSGQRLPTMPAAIKIAKALNTTVDYLANDTSYLVAENEIPYSSKKSHFNSLFNLLNQDGQAKVITYIEDLISTNKYKR